MVYSKTALTTFEWILYVLGIDPTEAHNYLTDEQLKALIQKYGQNNHGENEIPK